MASLRILVTGADGFLAQAAVLAIREAGHTALTTGRRSAGGRGATAQVRRAAASTEAPSLWFTNEYRTPLHVADAAQALVAFVVDPDGPNLFHLPGPERLSRWQLAQRFCSLHGIGTEMLEPAECRDPMRPRDVSLLGNWRASRSLDAMLIDS